MNTDLQKSIIGSLISDNSMYFRYMQDDMSFDYMTDETLIDITEKIVNEIKSGKRVDGIKAKALNPKNEKLITECVLSSSIQSFEMYHNELVVRHKSRTLTDLLSYGILSLENQDDPDEVGVLLSHKIEQMAAAKTLNEVVYKDSVMESAKYIIDRRYSGDKLSGVDTGYDDLNELTDGFQRGTVAVTAARPGMGKTSESLIRCYRAAKRGVNVVYVSIEVSRQALIRKLIAFELQITDSQARKGKINDEQEKKIHQIVDLICKTTLRIVDHLESIDDIEAFCTIYNSNLPIDFVCTDYLQLIKNRSHEEVRLAIDNTCQRYTRLMKKIDAAGNMLSQVSRAGSSIEPPQLKHLKESGGIEENAHIVMFLHRPGYYEPEMGDEAQIIFAKHRDGPLGTIYRKFDHPYLEYKEIGGSFEETKATEFDSADILPAFNRLRLSDDTDVQF